MCFLIEAETIPFCYTTSMEVVTKNIAETEAFARDFLKKLKPNPKEATVLALCGDLGSGKTTFTQYLAKELGIRNYVTSPTFVIQKRYNCAKNQLFKTLIHIDCYRLNSGDELLHLDWEETVHDPDNLIVLEWPERVEEILPKDRIEIAFEFVSENERKITLV